MTFDDATRARIARGWLNSSLDQPTYAAMHGVSERTLRTWVSRYGAGRRPHAHLRAAIVAAIEQLQNVQAALDAEAAAGPAAAAEDGQEAAEDPVERHAGPARPVVPSSGPAVSPEVEVLAPTPNVAGAGDSRDARRAARDHEAEPEVAGADLAAPYIVAVVDRAGETPAPSGQAARAVEQNEPRPSHCSAAAGVVDLDALRERLHQRRVARAPSGTPRKKSFFDWDAE